MNMFSAFLFSKSEIKCYSLKKWKHLNIGEHYCLFYCFCFLKLCHAQQVEVLGPSSLQRGWGEGANGNILLDFIHIKILAGKLY